MTTVLEPTVGASGPLAEVVGADMRVPLVTGGSRRYVNFDYAAGAPALVVVNDLMQRLLPAHSGVNRGAGYLSQVSTACYDEARRAVSRFVNSTPDQSVVFTRNTTDSLNLLASCVPGDTVVLDVEHHANLSPWRGRGRRVVPAADTIAETLRRLVAAMCAKPTALLAVTGASNVTGELPPIDRLTELAHRCGARVVVDAAQLAPRRRIDLAATDVDYLAFSGHKLYAPFGAGVLVGRRDWLEAAPPYFTGGSPNVLGAAALAAACEALRGIDGLRQLRHERALTDRLSSGLARIPGVRLLRAFSDAPDTVGIVAFTVDGHHPGRVAAYLSAEHGIGVRDGRFGAQALLTRLGVDAAVRASVGLGTGAADVDLLLGAVRTLVTSGPAWRYQLDEGHWGPSPETRPLPRQE